MDKKNTQDILFKNIYCLNIICSFASQVNLLFIIWTFLKMYYCIYTPSCTKCKLNNADLNKMCKFLKFFKHKLNVSEVYA